VEVEINGGSILARAGGLQTSQPPQGGRCPLLKF